ncbi:5-hydroxytryptamine receptor 3A [Larimichthys crocea]|uniref:5-hydroxytryptamine receptor 3A n=1 Tax=Larimichthys crocea TaxID=215358 RepID=A0A6G0IRW6_LARCR|nr:5-hydroxytryptamine receptor 3A [Larimichthys crocea]
MEQTEWTRIFQKKVDDLNKGDYWRLQFDDSIVPNSPNQGWKQYIRNTGARFKCTTCGRSWPSNKAMVVFHMQLIGGQGTVKIRRMRQNCKQCSAAPMEIPSITSENIDILLENLVEKIREKCYHEDLGRGNKPFVNLEVKSPHEPAHSTSSSDTDRMAQAEWTRIFQNKVDDLNKGDYWRLQFDDRIVPNSPNQGWKEYIRNTGARFRCTRCGRSWPSNKAMVVFHMQLIGGQGTVKMRRMRQNCKKCSAAPMEIPSITSENIDILLENLVEKIREKCYHEDLGRGNKPFVNLEVKSPHEPAHCSDAPRCGRSWPSNKAMVVFHMQLIGGQGTVKMRRMRQNCKKCSAAPMEIPSITSENIDILLENLVEKIREKCYHEDLGRGNKPFVNLEVKSPHEPAHSPSNSVMLNCSRPDPPSLLEALRPVFNLSSIRPVMNMSTPTTVGIDFILFGILGVVTVKRRSTLYVVNLLIPSCFLITVDLLSFLLPPRSVDRSLFKMTLILGYTVFLLIMNDLLPITGDTIPLMNVFLSLCMAMMVTSLLETILITNLLCGSAHYPPVPHWIQVFVLHILGRLVQLPPKPRDLEETVFQNPAAQEMKVSSVVAEDSVAPKQKGLFDEDKALQELRSLGNDLQIIHHQLKKQLGGNLSSEEWIQVGFVIDRLLFGLYIVFISVSFITILIIWMNSNDIS